jgi:hypothetical protein
MVDLNTLLRRELQALCKLNGVRANITNLARVEALQSLPSVSTNSTLLIHDSPFPCGIRTAIPTGDLFRIVV